MEILGRGIFFGRFALGLKGSGVLRWGKRLRVGWGWESGEELVVFLGFGGLGRNGSDFGFWGGFGR